jgi:type II secretion system protein H
MMVVVLIGITVTFVNLNLAPDPARMALREADRVAALLRQLADESTLRGRAMSLLFDEHSQQYRFEVVDVGEWKQISDSLFRQRSFQQPVKAALSMESQSRPGSRDVEDRESEDDSNHGFSRIVVNPLGEMTPFVLTLNAQNHLVNVKLDAFDNVIVEAVEVE